MKQSPFMTAILLMTAVSSLLFGGSSYLSKEREMRRRTYVEESLLRATHAKLMMEKELDTQKGKAALLDRQLLAMERTNRFTLVRLRGLERKLSVLQRDFAQIETAKESLESEVASLRGKLQLAGSEKGGVQEIDLGQIVVSAMPNVEGKVIAVNRPFQFVVIDLGDEQNLPVGAVLSIYRERNFIGRIQVEEVRETVAACRILPEWTRQEIQENDLVKEL